MIALSGSGQDGDCAKTAQPHSGWQVLIWFGLIAVAIFALFLLYYFLPTPIAWIETRPNPTAATRPVHLSVGGKRFLIPANYIVYSSERQRGPHRRLTLAALMPDFRGYSLAHAPQFADDSARSQVVHLRIWADDLALSETAQLQRVLLTFVKSPQGKTGPFGLIHYRFRGDNGYRGQDLFVGVYNGQTIVLRCWRAAGSNQAPDCMRDLRLGHNVVLSYRFKRAYLGQWRQIAQGVRQLIAKFVPPSP
jgi:hypothetical protein